MGTDRGRHKGYAELGQRLALLRHEAGLDPSVLAGRAGVPLQKLEAFEIGEQPLGAGALSRLAEVLGIPSRTLTDSASPRTHAAPDPSVLLATSGTADLGLSDRERLASLLRRARRFSEAGRLLREPRACDEFVPSVAAERDPHVEGYSTALRARAMLPERPGPLRDLVRLVEARFDILVVSTPFDSPEVLGAACRSGDARLVAVNRMLPRESRLRFVVAHELGHQLMDLSEQGTLSDRGNPESERFSLENPPTERRANAFAAMFLAPRDGVAQLLGAPTPGGVGLEAARALALRLREHFGIGFAAAAWHLLNLGYIRASNTVDALLCESPPLEAGGFENPTRHDGLDRRLFAARERGLITAARERELAGRTVFDEAVP